MSTQARASLVQPHRLAGATILQLAPDDDDAGGNALTIALLLQRAGARPIIAGRNGPRAEAWRSAGGEWLKLDHDSLNPLKLRRNAARLATFLARERVDIVHAYNAGAAWSALAATEKLAVWLVTNLPDIVPAQRSLRRIYQTSLARGDHVIVHSSFTAAPMIERFDIARERITVVPHPIDAQLFDPATMRPDRVLALRKAWKIPRGDRIILVPGPIAESAGQSVLVDAARLVPAGLLRNVIFVLLGDMNTGRGYVRTLNKRIAAHGLTAKFRLPGRCADWPAALAAADIVIASTGAQRPVLTLDLIKDVRKARRGRPLCLLDIAVPRDVEPEVGKLDGIYLFDIDALQKVAGEHRAEREEEAAEAEAVVEEELGRFVKRWRSRQRGPVVSALQTHFHGIARAEVMRLSGGVDEKERKARLDIAESLVKKLLHLPMTALRDDDPDDAVSLVQALQRLFSLSPVAAVPASEEAPAGSEANVDKKATGS